jgi:hypothetical protein
MSLDEAQRKKVAGWITEGLKLSEIQNRLASELGVSLTYMAVRLLVDDLKLTPKDTEPPAPSGRVLSSVASGGATAGARPAPAQPGAAESEPPLTPGGTVSVSVDKLARPGSFVSGKVTFSDGNQADWHLDQAGRLGLVPQKPGYRPPAEDLDDFRAALETELSKLGF